MSKEAKEGNYRRLSIASLVTGILTYTTGFIISTYPTSYLTISQISGYTGTLSAEFIVFSFISVVIGLGLPIAAIICGSIDLNKIQAGIYSNKGRGFDITGIVLGSTYLMLRTLEEFNLIQITFG
jgi:hypothetical protein